MEEQVKSAENPSPEGTVEDAKTPEQSAPANLPVNPRFEGKSSEELAKIVSEQEKLIGRQGNELGQVRQLQAEMEEMRRALYEAQRPQPQPAPPEAAPVFDYTNPDAYIEKRLGALQQKMYQEFGRYEQQRQAQEATIAFQGGKAEAMSRNRDLFNGIERDVEAQLWNAAKNNQIHPSMLRDPATWENAAKVIRLTSGEYDIVPKKRVQGMTAPESVVPGKVKAAEDEDVYLDDEERVLAKQLGISDKEALEIMRSEKGKVSSGTNVPRGKRR
jgi:hypothetical protein